LPDATFAPAQVLLARLRQIKTPAEIDILRRLSRIADKAITDAYRSVSAGASEMDLAAALTRGVYAQGAEYFKLMIVATGERSVFPNVGPTERVLKRGDVCRVEIFPMIGGYHAGVCRTAAVEAPPPQAERIWANLTACKHLLLAAIKPGASTRAIYDLYLGKLGELGLPPISFIGHGIGLHLHEDPYLGLTADQPLEAGMVLGIELIVPRAAGGVVDVVGRFWAEQVKPQLGNIVIENQGGGGGIIAAQAVARAKPDGHTLLAGTTTELVISPATTTTSYDPQKDLAP